MNNPIVLFEKVSKRIGTSQAVRDLDLSIKRGELVAILGPNGAGKTTALSLMVGLRKPTSGSVKLCGGDPRMRQSRQRVAAMLQDCALPTPWKVHEIVELFRRLYQNPMTVAETLAAAQLTGLEDKRIGTLSGGQRQRLCFALALVGNPDVLFLDEPTVAMDVESRREFWEEIRRLAARGKTIVLTTHYLEEADALADRIIILNQGTVVAEGSPAEIKRRVAGSDIRFHSFDTRYEDLAGLPGVIEVHQKDSDWWIRTTHPEENLREIFEQGKRIANLSVSSIQLEDAVLAITRTAKQEH